MRIPVFLSHPTPYNTKQKEFIEKLKNILKDRGLEPRTLGVTDYNMTAPLTTIRRLMLESNGVLCVALKRYYIEKGITNKDSDLDREERDISNKYITSPYCQIEPAMGFQLGLPILILREKDVIDDGLLEKGVLGIYMPSEIDLSKSPEEYFDNEEIKSLLDEWGSYVRSVAKNKGNPPKLY